VTSETVSALETLVIKRVQTTFRGLGFAGSKQTYRLRTGGYEFAAKIIKSRRNTKDHARFTVALGAMDPETDTGFWSARLGHLLPFLTDYWWELETGADVGPVSDQVAQALTDFAWQGIQTLLQVPGLPGSSLPRLWQRPLTGVEDEDRGNLSFADQLREQTAAGYLMPGWTTTELVDRLATDPVLRSMVILEILRRDLQDSDVAAALADRFEHDRNPVLRGYAARAYGCLALGEDVPSRLQLAANEDEDLSVRWNARYAIEQRSEYGPGWLKTTGNQWWRPRHEPLVLKGTGMILSRLPPELVSQFPSEAARRGMTVDELTIRLRLGALPSGDPLMAFVRLGANQTEPST
jgi:hypothetical protein